MKMGFSDRQKQAGIRLELTWFEPRKCWKKKHSGKVKYFRHPDTKAGYEAALQEWFGIKDELQGKQKNAPLFNHFNSLFGKVQKWYDAFGVPASETKLSQQVSAFLDYLVELRATGSPNIPLIEFSVGPDKGSFTEGRGGRIENMGVQTPGKREEFWSEFIHNESGFSNFGTINYDLPPKWIDRIDRAGNRSLDKEPQTIDHWLKRYNARTEERAGKVIAKRTAKDRKNKLSPFGKFCDRLAHITMIDSDFIERYHAHLDELKLSKASKEGYFAVFRMFVRWCSHQKACDLTLPSNLESREFAFREPLGVGRKRQEKKSRLWTKEEFLAAIGKMPAPYPCYLMLFLNCGFRHVDLGELRKSDYHKNEGRIVIQRNKLNQQDTAPVISYKLWKKTVELLEEAMASEGEYVFRNQKGGSVENSIKSYWKRNSDKYAKGKRLDYLRKTGATSIARFQPSGKIDDMYLGEALDSTAKIHYSFADGEPCQALDDAIQNLGAEFGFCEKPFQRVQLTPEILKLLEYQGVDISKL